MRDVGLRSKDSLIVQRILELKSLISHPSSLIPNQGNGQRSTVYGPRSTLTFVRATLPPSPVPGNQLLLRLNIDLMADILMIDDEKAIRKTLTEILSFEGYKIDEASDGEEGLKRFKEKNYDVVLCDIKMPTIDGIEFLQK